MISSIIVTLLLVNSVISTSEPEVKTNDQSTPVSNKQLTDLVMMSFEGFRRLIQESSNLEGDKKEGQPAGPAQYSPIHKKLDPLFLQSPAINEHRDPKSPVVGKLVLTLSNVQISGLSSFRVDKVENKGPTLKFIHTIPKLDSRANYTVDYHLFDAIPLRISEGCFQATIPNAKVNGSFLMFPDVFREWFKVSQFNLTTVVDEEVAIAVDPKYTISDRFVLDRGTMAKFDEALRSLLPELDDILMHTYSKAIEMKLIE